MTMKKIFIIIITLISLNVYSQSTIRTGANIINDSDTLSLLKNVNDDFEINSSISLIIDADTLKGEALIIKDSTVTSTYSGVLTNTTYVTNAVTSANYNSDSVAAYNVTNLIMAKTDTINYADSALNVSSSLTLKPSNIDLSSVPAGAVLFEAGDTIGYIDSMYYNDNTLHLRGTVEDTVLFIKVEDSSNGLIMEVPSNALGMYINVQNGGGGIQVNTRSDNGILVSKTGDGNGIHAYTSTSNGTAVKIEGLTNAAILLDVETVSNDNALTIYDDSVTTDLPTTIHNQLTVDSFQIGDGDVLTSFDTISINDVVYNDTLLFNTANWVQFGSDSTAVYDKSWNWKYNLGKP